MLEPHNMQNATDIDCVWFYGKATHEFANLPVYGLNCIIKRTSGFISIGYSDIRNSLEEQTTAVWNAVLNAKLPELPDHGRARVETTIYSLAINASIAEGDKWDCIAKLSHIGSVVVREWAGTPLTVLPQAIYEFVTRVKC